MKNEAQIKEIVEIYKNSIDTYEEFAAKLKEYCKNIVNNAGLKNTIVDSRCKSVDSLEDKLKRDGKNYTEVSEVTDLCGVRIILDSNDDLEFTKKLITNEFNIDVVASEDKRDKFKPHEFGYMSVHYIVSLKSDKMQDDEWFKYSKIKAEVQIRTVLQHAWALISHAIDYKQEHDVPLSLRRQLFRLSALLELGDEQLTNLKAKKRDLMSKTEKSIEKGDFELELNKDSLNQYISTSKNVIALLKSAREAGFNVARKDRFLSAFIGHCQAIEINTFSQIEDLLENIKPIQDDYLKKLLLFHNNSINSNSWEGSSSFFVFLGLLLAKKMDINIEDFLVKSGWSKYIIKSIVEVYGDKDSQD